MASLSVPIALMGECAAAMKSADPRVYDRFLIVLRAYVDDVTAAVIEAPTEDILVAKGRAQQARKFLQLMTETKPSP